MQTEDHALKKRLPFTTFFQSVIAAFIGIKVTLLISDGLNYKMKAEAEAEAEAA